MITKKVNTFCHRRSHLLPRRLHLLTKRKLNKCLFFISAIYIFLYGLKQHFKNLKCPILIILYLSKKQIQLKKGIN
jgi:hypothetical protein